MTKSFIFALLASASLLLAGCSLPAQAQVEPTPTTAPAPPVEEAALIAEGRLEPAESAWLGFERTGRVAEVLVEEGETVEEGQPLARLDGQESGQAALRAAELERLSAQQALDELAEQAGLASESAWGALVEARQAAVEAHQALDDLNDEDYRQEIDDAWVTAQDEKSELEDAQEEFDKYIDLDEDNADRENAADDLESAQKEYNDALREYERLKNDLEAAEASAAQADAAVEDAQREYEKLQDGPDPDELDLAQARLDNAEAQVAAAQAALEDLELVAPFAGQVTAVDISSGEQVSPNQPLFQLADFSSWFVETTDLTEIDVVKVDPEGPVTIIPDALPELELDGRIERISDAYSESAGDVLYMVRIRLDDVDPRLRWGMTVETQFGEK
jgi:multidrug efflux pump subunit AcrA (membrane-fusion protein)